MRKGGKGGGGGATCVEDPGTTLRNCVEPAQLCLHRGPEAGVYEGSSAPGGLLPGMTPVSAGWASVRPARPPEAEKAWDSCAVGGVHTPELKSGGLRGFCTMHRNH